MSSWNSPYGLMCPQRSAVSARRSSAVSRLAQPGSASTRWIMPILSVFAAPEYRAGDRAPHLHRARHPGTHAEKGGLRDDPGYAAADAVAAGADKLCNLFGIVIQYDSLEKSEDWTGESHNGEPFFYYQVRGRAYRGEFLMGEGVGACSSWESKYRYRNAERTCPNCNKPNIRKSKEGGWYCWRKTDGCGATFPDGSQAVESQAVGRKLNPDITDTVNTISRWPTSERSSRPRSTPLRLRNFYPGHGRAYASSSPTSL